jgi:hypothetical protein
MGLDRSRRVVFGLQVCGIVSDTVGIDLRGCFKPRVLGNPRDVVHCHGDMFTTSVSRFQFAIAQYWWTPEDYLRILLGGRDEQGINSDKEA